MTDTPLAAALGRLDALVRAWAAGNVDTKPGLLEGPLHDLHRDVAAAIAAAADEAAALLPDERNTRLDLWRYRSLTRHIADLEALYEAVAALIANTTRTSPLHARLTERQGQVRADLDQARAQSTRLRTSLLDRAQPKGTS